MSQNSYPLLLDKCQGKTNYLFDNHYLMENKYWKNTEVFSRAEDSNSIATEYHGETFHLILSD